MQDHAKHWRGARLRKFSTSSVLDDIALVLQRPVESAQYCFIDYQTELRQHGIAISMSGNGNCYDNAIVEACPIIPRIIGCCALQNHQNRNDLAYQVWAFIPLAYVLTQLWHASPQAARRSAGETPYAGNG
jgi:hypothetical protein